MRASSSFPCLTLPVIRSMSSLSSWPLSPGPKTLDLSHSPGLARKGYKLFQATTDCLCTRFIPSETTHLLRISLNKALELEGTGHGASETSEGWVCAQESRRLKLERLLSPPHTQRIGSTLTHVRTLSRVGLNIPSRQVRIELLVK